MNGHQEVSINTKLDDVELEEVRLLQGELNAAISHLPENAAMQAFARFLSRKYHTGDSIKITNDGTIISSNASPYDNENEEPNVGDTSGS